MLKPEELVPREVWTVVLSKLSTEDELSCRCVCVSFKKEVDSILKNNQDRLWLRHRDDQYGHYFCYDKDHRISFRDTLYFDKTICMKKLKFVSKLMPSLRILQLDLLPDTSFSWGNTYSGWYDEVHAIDWPDYRDDENKAVPITKIFPQVACLILPGQTENDNFVGDLSQVKHLTLYDGIQEGLPKFPNLDSLDVRDYRIDDIGYTMDFNQHLPSPSNRFVVPRATIEWSTLPKTLEIIDTNLDFDEYISIGKPHFSNLKILKGLYEERNLETLMNFLKDHKGSLTELCFSVGEHVGNIKVLVPLLTQLQKLSVTMKTDKQAIELKEIKTLAHNLQYFELSFDLWSGTEKHFGAILDNLPLGLDNFSIEGVTSYEEIDTFMEKIMEKIVNGDTTRVTIAGIDNDDDYTKRNRVLRENGRNTTDIIEKIVKMKPEPVRVEKRNSRVVVEEGEEPCYQYLFRRTQYSRTICDIVISL